MSRDVLGKRTFPPVHSPLNGVLANADGSFEFVVEALDEVGVAE
jgi:hypothetical protein